MSKLTNKQKLAFINNYNACEKKLGRNVHSISLKDLDSGDFEEYVNYKGGRIQNEGDTVRIIQSQKFYNNQYYILRKSGFKNMYEFKLAKAKRDLFIFEVETGGCGCAKDKAIIFAQFHKLSKLFAKLKENQKEPVMKEIDKVYEEFKENSDSFDKDNLKELFKTVRELLADNQIEESYEISRHRLSKRNLEYYGGIIV